MPVKTSAKLFKSLLYKAAQIRKLIDEEQRSRWSNRFRLLRLKKLHLALQDRIQRVVAASMPEPQLQPVRIRKQRHQLL